MSIEDIIEEFVYTQKIGETSSRYAEALASAIPLLKTHPDNQPNEPLTLEELRGMAGQPVWIKKGLEISEWAIVLGREDLFCLHFAVLRGQMRLAPKEYGTVWFAYRRPPKEVTP